MVYMSTAELRYRYANMDVSQDRLAILADLNGCTKREIRDILNVDFTLKKRNRVYTKKIRGHETIEDLMLLMWQYGCTDGYIASKVGLKDCNVWYWRKKNNLPASRTTGTIRPEELEAWEVMFGNINPSNIPKQYG